MCSKLHLDKAGHLNPCRYLLWLVLLIVIAGCDKKNHTPIIQLVGSGQGNDLATLRQRAQSGTAADQYELGHHFVLNNTLPYAGKEAALWLRKAAAQGHASAQFEMAMLLINGHTTALEPNETLKWITAAANQAHADAEFVLGMLYDQGRHVEQNSIMAGQWVLKAATHGNKDAQHASGNMFAYGYNGMQINKAEAIKWYRAAAEQGHSGSQGELGARYDRGIDVPQNDQEALRWYQLAAAQGNSLSLFNLSVKYTAGMGVPQDDIKAAQYSLQAASLGNAMGQAVIGQFYARGKGVSKDNVQAYAWLTLALQSQDAKNALAADASAESFWGKAEQWRTHVSKEMAIEQLVEAAKRMEAIKRSQAPPLQIPR